MHFNMELGKLLMCKETDHLVASVFNFCITAVRIMRCMQQIHTHIEQMR